MKLSSALVVAAYAQQGDKKVPPRHPLQRLERLVEFGEEIMNDWFEFLPSKMNWQNKFRKNADRMTLAFTRCGYYDENLMPHGGPGLLNPPDNFLSPFNFLIYPFQNQMKTVKEEIPLPLKICSDQLTDTTVKIQQLV